MINTTLINLLKSLSKEELIYFEDFINSPFFNKKKPVIKLLKYLKGFHPDFEKADKISGEKIYKKLYPGKSYNYGVMKNLFYELNLLGEKYIKIIKYNKNEYQQVLNLLSELIDRKLNQSFRKNLKKAELLFQKASKDDIYFRNKMDLELLKFNFHINSAGRTAKPRFGLKADEYLILFFLTKFFKINYNNIVTRDNFGIFEDIAFLDEVLSYVQKESELDPVILLYYNAFMLIYTENEAVYLQYKKLVKEQIKNFNRKEQFNTYSNLLNYCYGKIASGEWSYYKELFEIYNEMLGNNIITQTENDYFDIVHFRIAAETGTRLKKFGWVKKFVMHYSEKLPPKFKANEINIAFANYHFNKKDYDEAQKYLSQTHIYTAYDKVYLYIIQSMIHFETKQFENLISEVDAIKHFIINDKSLWVESRNSFKKYVDYLNELVKLTIRNPENKTHDIKKLRNKLISESGILEKGWLLEKMNEKANIN